MLGQLEVTEVDLDGAPGIMLAADEPAAAPMHDMGPWAALLPALDPTAMGWRERGWYVGEHAAALFDRSGNIGPTAWWDGRIVGGWAQRKDGEIAVRLLEDIGAEPSAAIAAEAQRLREWIGPGRVTPRFRTPLERELAGLRTPCRRRYRQPPEHRGRARQSPVAAGRALKGDTRGRVRQERREHPAKHRTGLQAAVDEREHLVTAPGGLDAQLSGGDRRPQRQAYRDRRKNQFSSVTCCGTVSCSGQRPSRSSGV